MVQQQCPITSCVAAVAAVAGWCVLFRVCGASGRFGAGNHQNRDPSLKNSPGLSMILVKDAALATNKKWVYDSKEEKERGAEAERK